MFVSAARRASSCCNMLRTLQFLYSDVNKLVVISVMASDGKLIVCLIIVMASDGKLI